MKLNALLREIKNLSAYCIGCLSLTLLVTAPARADLAVDISANKNTVIAGTNLELQFDVRNTFIITTVTNAFVTTTLPSGAAFLSDNGNCDTTSLPQITCQLGTIPAQQTRSVRIAVNVSDDFVATTGGAGFVTITGQADGNSTPASPVASLDVSVGELADLQLSHFVTTLQPQAGETFVYTLLVDNFGPSSARNVAIDISAAPGLDDILTVQSCALSVSVSGGSISEFKCTTGPITGGQFPIVLSDLGTNFVRSNAAGIDGPAGRVRAALRIVASEAVDLTLIARVSTLTPDSDLSNNQASQLTEVAAIADLSIEKTAVGELQLPDTQALPYDVLSGAPFPEAPNFSDSNIAVTAGRRIRYTLDVENTGPSDASNVVVTDRLPPNVQVVPGSLSITGASGSCQFGTPGSSDDKMTCNLGKLVDPSEGAGSSAKIEFDVVTDLDLSVGTVLSNNAFVSSSTADNDNSNNVDGALTVVGPLTGVSGCSAGGAYTNVACGTGDATLSLSGFGFAVPGNPVTYAWSSSCPNAVFTDAAAASTSVTFNTADANNAPVSCDVSLQVQNAFSQATCSAPVTVVDCSVDCNGALGGISQLDRCGVCEGDGNSCLGCKQFDSSADISEFVNNALRLRGIALRNAKRLHRDGSFSQARKIRKNARSQYQSAVDQALALPTNVTSCTNAAFCVQSSNVASVDSLGDGLTALGSTANSSTKKVRRKIGKRAAKRLLKRAQALSDAAQAALTRLPLESSVCS